MRLIVSPGCEAQVEVRLKRGVCVRTIDIAFRTGVHVTGVDVGKKQLTTADNDTIGYEKLIIATGARVRVPGCETIQSSHLGGHHCVSGALACAFACIGHARSEKLGELKKL
jgi:NADPH-dependent 2,4-dienoyl-CoA reductase/sulfur reductase-like enzyme